MKNNKNKTAVILIDMQEFFLQHFQKNIRKQLIKNQIEFLNFCKKQNIPVIVTEYKCRNIFRGKIIPELKSRLKGIEWREIIKLNNSGFTETELDKVLKEMNIKEIVLVGINANACVQDTAISALNRGYKVIVSKDLIASGRRKDTEFSKKNLEWYKKNTKFFDQSSLLISYLCK